MSKQAQFDLVGIFKYSKENWGGLQAVKYINYLRKTLNLIATFSNLGRFVELEENRSIRSFSVKQHLVIYQESKDLIIIKRILNHNLNHPRGGSFFGNDV